MNDKRNIKRNNAKLYPIYKMFSWDLLFFYSIEFLFCTITKGISVSQILITNGFYLFFRILMQIPAVTIVDFIGKRKSIILGNMLLILFILTLIGLPGVISLLIANLIFALGYNIKTIAETNLLYDSVSTKGGEGIYSKIDAKGGSWYYLLDGMAALISGYLFVINNYIPVLLCLLFIIISTVLAFGFKDVYKPKQRKNSFIGTVKDYKIDLKQTLKFIFNSKRMKAFILFQIVLNSTIEIISTYCNSLLLDIGIQEEQFSMIFAILSLIGGISLSFKGAIEKKFKNRTLSVISLTYIGTCVIVGILSSCIANTKMIIPIILIIYAAQKMCTSIWFIIGSKYLKNFTKPQTRNKITFTYEFLGASCASIFSILGGLLIKVINVRNAFLIVGLFSLACIIVVLDYMKTRFGLNPKEYKKEDIFFDIS